MSLSHHRRKEETKRKHTTHFIPPVPRIVSLQHQSQRVLQILLEHLQPPCPQRPIDHPVIATHGNLHHRGRLEPLFRVRVGNQFGLCGADGEDAGLRGVDDGGKVVDSKHAEVGDGEGAAL